MSDITHIPLPVLRCGIWICMDNSPVPAPPCVRGPPSGLPAAGSDTLTAAASAEHEQEHMLGHKLL